MSTHFQKKKKETAVKEKLNEFPWKEKNFPFRHAISVVGAKND